MRSLWNPEDDRRARRAQQPVVPGALAGTLVPVTLATDVGIVRWQDATATTPPLPIERLNWQRLPDLLGPGRYWDVLFVVAIIQRYGDLRSGTEVCRGQWRRWELPNPRGFGYRFLPAVQSDEAYREGWLFRVEDSERATWAPFPTDSLRAWLAEHFDPNAIRPSRLVLPGH